jgi:hypothetical protein
VEPILRALPHIPVSMSNEIVCSSPALKAAFDSA